MFRFATLSSWRNVRNPSSNLPACMRSNRSRFSSTLRLRTTPARLSQGVAILPHSSALNRKHGIARLDQLNGPLIQLISQSEA